MSLIQDQKILNTLSLSPLLHIHLAGVHPSPLSAHTGFFGSKPFSKTNALLEIAGTTPIAWALSETGVTASEDPR